jgi:uncharacterized protein
MPTDSTKDHLEALLDETIEESFPASDAPGNTVQTGALVGSPATPRVVDNRDASQFELHADGQTAFLRYARTPSALTLIHTEVPESLRGRHLGDLLAKAGIEAALAEGLTLIVQCPFVRAYQRKHPQ